jgi:hypothetical protein
MADLDAGTLAIQEEGVPVRDREAVRLLVDRKLNRLVRRGMVTG